jgi:hypothetical protein
MADRHTVAEYGRVAWFTWNLLFFSISLPVFAWIAVNEKTWDMRISFGAGALVCAWVVFNHVRWLWKGKPIRCPKGYPVRNRENRPHSDPGV